MFVLWFKILMAYLRLYPQLARMFSENYNGHRDSHGNYVDSSDRPPVTEVDSPLDRAVMRVNPDRDKTSAANVGAFAIGALCSVGWVLSSAVDAGIAATKGAGQFIYYSIVTDEQK